MRVSDVRLSEDRTATPRVKGKDERERMVYLPASAELARQTLDLSEREELRQLIGELKHPNLEADQRRKVLEQMARILAETGPEEESPAAEREGQERCLTRTHGSEDGAYTTTIPALGRLGYVR